MNCKKCGETYDEELFPVCPYCLFENNIIYIDDCAEKNLPPKSLPSRIDCEILKTEIAEDNNKIENCYTDKNKITINDTIIINKKENEMDLEDLNDISNENKYDNERFLIKNVFHQSKFRSFVRYCTVNSIEYVDELTHFDFNELYNIRGLTNKLVEDVIIQYDRFCSKHGLKKNTFILSNDETIFDDNVSLVSETQEQVGMEITVENEDNILISDAFFQSKFNMFRKYCSENNLRYVYELKTFDFKKLNDVRGMGTKKVEDIIKRYNEIVDKYEGTIDTEKLYIVKNDNVRTENNKAELYEEEKCFANINLELKNLNINFLSNFDIKQSTIAHLQIHSFNTVGSLENISKSQLQKVIGKNEFIRFSALEKLLSKSFLELFASFLIRHSDTNKYNCMLFKASGFTLQEIADLLGITRERVRQNIVAFNRRLDPFMAIIVQNFFEDENYIPMHKILNLYDNDDFDRILVYWCKNNTHLNYFDAADVILPASISIDEIENSLLLFAEELIGNGKRISDCYNDIDEYLNNNDLSYFSEEMYISFLLKNGYSKSGGFITKGRHSYGYICARIIAEKFPDGIKIHEGDDLIQLRKYAEEEYGDIGLPEENRALSARIADFTILCGRGKVIAEERVNVDNFLLEEIKEYIDSAQEAQIYYSEIFAHFEGLISMMSNIDNYHFLHGVLKFYFPEEYSYGRDCLTKKGENYISGKFSDRLRNYIIDCKRPVTKAEIFKKFSGISEARLWTAIAADNNILQWEFNSVYLLELIDLSDDIVNKLQELVESILNKYNGYCSEKLLYKTIQRELPEFLTYNNINKSEILFFICSKLFKDFFDFRRPHVSKKDLFKEMTVKSIALYLMNYPDEMCFSEYRSIINDFDWPDVTSGMVFSEIEQDYIRISDDCYLKKELFHIPTEVLCDIEHTLKRNMNKGFLSLLNFEFKESLPQFFYEWNEFLLRSIIDNYLDAFRIVTTAVKDRRYERGIIVDANCDIENYEDVVIALMRSENISSLQESKMLSLLVMNNLTYKVIPRELYEDRKLKYENGYFSIKIM